MNDEKRAEGFYRNVVEITARNNKKEVTVETRNTIDLIKREVLEEANLGKDVCSVRFKNRRADMNEVSLYFTNEGFEFTYHTERCIDGFTIVEVSWKVDK